MKKLFIIANWKSNKTIKEAEEWMHSFQKQLEVGKISQDNKEVIVAASFNLLEHMNYCAKNLKLSIKFAAQNISPFDKGAYTGEVNGEQIKELADYVIVGHSERRQNFHEDEMMLERKINQGIKYDIKPILCIQSKDSMFPQGVKIVAYEPVFAIGTGNPDSPDSADDVAEHVKVTKVIKHVLYGGSVTPDNVGNFTQMPHIDGVLIGGASLDAQKFYAIIKNA